MTRSVRPFARIAERKTENSVATISKEEIQAFYKRLLQVLKSGDITSLERIYGDDYLLVRPNGDTFGKNEILKE
jgi:hypothetical protein